MVIFGSGMRKAGSFAWSHKARKRSGGHKTRREFKMRTHYDMQREVIEAALRLLDDVEYHGDTFGLEAYRRHLAESRHRFLDADFRYLTEIEERAARFQSLKARCDKADDGEIDDAIDHQMDIEREWLVAQCAILNERFERLLLIPKRT